LLELEPKSTCLLVIDVENDYCHEQGAFGQMRIPLENIQNSVRRLIPFIKEARQTAIMVLFIRNQHSDWDDSPTWLTRRRRRGAEKLSRCASKELGDPNSIRSARPRQTAW
jgi:ureidoacrylate peracid hydrolase